MRAQFHSEADDLGATMEDVARVERQYTAKRVPLSGLGDEPLTGLMSRVSRVIFEPLFDGGTAQYACAPIGILAGGSLLVEWPRAPDGLAALKVNQPVRIKFFHDLSLIQIESDILSLQFQPKPHIHIAWPREVSLVEVREIRRIPVDCPSRFQLIDEEGALGETIEGRLLDISLSGAGFFVERDLLSPGMRGKLVIAVYPDPKQAPVSSRPLAEVCTRHEAKRRHPSGWIYGIEFSHLTSPDRLLIWSMIGQALELKREHE